MSRDPNPFLRAMLEAAAKVISYTNGLNQSEFVANSIIYDAVLRNLEIIGEAASRLSSEAQDLFPHLPFRSMRGMRNIIVHDYGEVDLELVWKTVTADLPPLVETLDRHFA